MVCAVMPAAENFEDGYHSLQEKQKRGKLVAPGRIYEAGTLPIHTTEQPSPNPDDASAPSSPRIFPHSSQAAEIPHSMPYSPPRPGQRPTQSKRSVPSGSGLAWPTQQPRRSNASSTASSPSHRWLQFLAVRLTVMGGVPIVRTGIAEATLSQNPGDCFNSSVCT